MLAPYPFGSISGATTAAKLMLAYGVDEATENVIRQFSALSIISDVMPVGGFTVKEMEFNENRFRLNDVLQRLHTKPAMQLAILCEVCGVDTKSMDEKDIGFTIGPVMNSTGRLADARIGVEILMSEDEELIRKNAGYALYLNNERKEITKSEAEKVSTSDEEAACVAALDAPAGIVGIIAGNICSRYDKPTVVFGRRLLPDGTCILAGSGRSSDVSLIDVFTAMPQDLFLGYGGHAKAAGVSISENSLEAFRREFCRKCVEMMPEKTAKENIKADFDSFNSPEAAEALKNMKPFGQGFPEPEFDIDFNIAKIDMFFASKHCAVSDTQGHQLWMYGQLSKGRDMAAVHSFRKVGDNTQKRIEEKGLSEEDAAAGHWERWVGRPAKYIADVNVNYGSFQGVTGIQLSLSELRR
jgi:single-stranded-DNA-specific exonuclease